MEQTQIDWNKIILAIISLIGAIIPLWFNYKLKQEEKRKKEEQIEKGEKPKLDVRTELKIKRLSILMYVCIIVLVAMLGLIVYDRFIKPPKIITPAEETTIVEPTEEITPDETTKVKITYPNDGNVVEIKETIRGTSQRVPNEHKIWVVIYPHGVYRYYPQSDSAKVQEDGEWSSSSYIGVEEDIGREFDIIAMLLDKKAQDTFNDYLTQAEKEKTYPGLEKLPEGSTIYDRITVTR